MIKGRKEKRGSSPPPGSPAGQPGWGGAVREGSVKTRAPAKSKTSRKDAKAQSKTQTNPHVFSPTLGDIDLHLFGEGRHERIYEKLGARVLTHDGKRGVAFAVWAPNANRISVVGNFNG